MVSCFCFLKNILKTVRFILWKSERPVSVTCVSPTDLPVSLKEQFQLPVIQVFQSFEGKVICTIWPRLPKSNGPPRANPLKFLLTSRLLFCAFDISSLYSLENLRPLLSLSCFSLVWNFLSAALDLCIAAYFAISWRSFSDHFL